MDAFVRGARALLPMESYVCVSQVRRYVYVTLEEFLARMANSGVSKEEAEEHNIEPGLPAQAEVVCTKETAQQCAAK